MGRFRSRSRRVRRPREGREGGLEGLDSGRGRTSRKREPARTRRAFSSRSLRRGGRGRGRGPSRRRLPVARAVLAEEGDGAAEPSSRPTSGLQPLASRKRRASVEKSPMSIRFRSSGNGTIGRRPSRRSGSASRRTRGARPSPPGRIPRLAVSRDLLGREENASTRPPRRERRALHARSRRARSSRPGPPSGRAKPVKLAREWRRAAWAVAVRQRRPCRSPSRRRQHGRRTRRRSWRRLCVGRADGCVSSTGRRRGFRRPAASRPRRSAPRGSRAAGARGRRSRGVVDEIVHRTGGL